MGGVVDSIPILHIYIYILSIGMYGDHDPSSSSSFIYLSVIIMMMIILVEKQQTNAALGGGSLPPMNLLQPIYLHSLIC